MHVPNTTSISPVWDTGFRAQVQGSGEYASSGLPCAPGSCTETSALRPYCLQLLVTRIPVLRMRSVYFQWVTERCVGDSQYRKT